MRVLVGYDKPTGSEVYLECFYSDDGNSIIKARIRCSEEGWDYSLEGLSIEEEEVLTDSSVHPDDKYDIYSRYLSEGRLESFEWF